MCLVAHGCRSLLGSSLANQWLLLVWSCSRSSFPYVHMYALLLFLALMMLCSVADEFLLCFLPRHSLLLLLVWSCTLSSFLYLHMYALLLCLVADEFLLPVCSTPVLLLLNGHLLPFVLSCPAYMLTTLLLLNWFCLWSVLSVCLSRHLLIDPMTSIWDGMVTSLNFSSSCVPLVSSLMFSYEWCSCAHVLLCTTLDFCSWVFFSLCSTLGSGVA